MVSFDDRSKHLEPFLGARAVLEWLAINVQPGEGGKQSKSSLFQPEIASFQLEATPGKPWGVCSADMLDVERILKMRFVSTLRT